MKMANKPGRPALPEAWKRVQVSTTLPLETAERIKKEQWVINELIIDGIKHRDDCKARFQKLETARDALQERVETLTKGED